MSMEKEKFERPAAGKHKSDQVSEKTIKTTDGNEQNLTNPHDIPTPFPTLDSFGEISDKTVIAQIQLAWDANPAKNTEPGLIYINACQCENS